MAEHWSAKGPLPVNGIIAYFTSIHAWLMFITINPIWGLMVPALHSLQYLVVVGRFQLNHERDRLKDDGYKPRSLDRRLFGDRAAPHLVMFFLLAGMLGWMGFWGLPGILDALVPYDNLNLTPTLFLFLSWTFINVHHYLMDNVMWRRENRNMKKYLFG